MENFNKFEDIVGWGNDNYDRYCLLRDIASSNKKSEQKELIIYFGAGSSLYSTAWADPFQKVCTDLTEKINRSIQINGIHKKKKLQNLKSIKSQPGQTQEKIGKAEEEKKAEYAVGKKLAEWHEALIGIAEELKKDNVNYLPIGDELDKIIKEFSETSYGKAIAFDLYKSFDDACCRMMGNDGDKVKNYDFTKYVTDHLFYVFYIAKYLKVGLITTNIDKCFTDVCKKVEPDSQPPYILCSKDVNEEGFPNSFLIVHLHGCIHRPNSLVMTKKDYDDVYPNMGNIDKLTNTQKLLLSVAKECHVVFLGTRLSSDTPIVLLNNYDNTFNTRRNKQLKYIPFLKNASGDFVTDCTTPIILEQFPDYSVVLHMLLRDTAEPRLFNCQWNQKVKELYDRDTIADLPETQKKVINKFLKSKKLYDSQEFNQDYQPILKYLCQTFLVSGEKGHDWNICCISDDRFSLDNKNDEGTISPLNNMPLGNTIYIIGDPRYSEQEGSESLSHSGIKKIQNAIADWRKKVYDVDLQKPMGDDLKVRVIIFPCQSENEKLELELIRLESQLLLSQNPEMTAELLADSQKQTAENVEEIIRLLYAQRKRNMSIQTYKKIILREMLITWAKQDEQGKQKTKSLGRK